MSPLRVRLPWSCTSLFALMAAACGSTEALPNLAEDAGMDVGARLDASPETSSSDAEGERIDDADVQDTGEEGSSQAYVPDRKLPGPCWISYTEEGQVLGKLSYQDSGYGLWMLDYETEHGWLLTERGVGHRPFWSGTWTRTLRHTYDEQGKLVRSETDTDGDQDPDLAEEFVYEGDLRTLVKMDLDADGEFDTCTAYEFGPDGLPTRAVRSHPCGEGEAKVWTFEFELDAEGRVLAERRTYADEEEPFHVHELSYDDAGNVVWEHFREPQYMAPPLETEDTHEHDAFGNRLSTLEHRFVEPQATAWGGGMFESWDRKTVYGYDCFRED